MDLAEPHHAMPLVVRLEKGVDVTRGQVLATAGSAVARLLASPAAADGGEWHEQIRQWTDGRIRKVVRRARGAGWERAAALPGVTATEGNAAVRAFPPTRVDELHADLRRLQVAGLDVPGLLSTEAAGDQLVVALNPEVDATTGKWAAQVGHAAQLMLAQLNETDRASWAATGFRVEVIAPDLAQFKDHEASSTVVVHDGGFTEVAPGTLMVVAHYAAEG